MQMFFAVMITNVSVLFTTNPLLASNHQTRKFREIFLDPSLFSRQLWKRIHMPASKIFHLGAIKDVISTYFCSWFWYNDNNFKPFVYTVLEDYLHFMRITNSYFVPISTFKGACRQPRTLLHFTRTFFFYLISWFHPFHLRLYFCISDAVCYRCILESELHIQTR